MQRTLTTPHKKTTNFLMAERFEQYLAKEAVWMAEKYTKRYESLEKCKLRSQWNTITHPLEWMNFLKLDHTNIGKDVEQLEASYTAGGDIKWHNFGKHFGSCK